MNFTSEHNFYSAKTRDISAGGLFIETNIGLPIGTRIRVDLRFLQNQATVEAEVVWALVGENGQTTGVGVQFVNLSPRGRGTDRNLHGPARSDASRSGLRQRSGGL